MKASLKEEEVKRNIKNWLQNCDRNQDQVAEGGKKRKENDSLTAAHVRLELK